jgi:transposase
MIQLSVQGMDVAGIAKVTFTSPDRVREVINNFNEDGFESLDPKYAGGRPPTLTLPQRAQIKKVALSRPVDHGLPFSTWSLAKLADFLVAEGVVDDISHEGLRLVLQAEEVSFKVIKTFKASTDPDYEAKKNRVLELCDIAEAKEDPGPGDPAVVFSIGRVRSPQPPAPGRQAVGGGGAALEKGSTETPCRRRRRATYKRTQGVRHLLAALDMNRDWIYAHVKTNKNRTTFPEFCRYLRTLYPPGVRIAIVCDNFSPHLSTAKDDRVAQWAERGYELQILARLVLSCTVVNYVVTASYSGDDCTLSAPDPTQPYSSANIYTWTGTECVPVSVTLTRRTTLGGP